MQTLIKELTCSQEGMWEGIEKVLTFDQKILPLYWCSSRSPPPLAR